MKTPGGSDSGEAQRNFPIVAIGASAGGLEAVTELLTHLPADTGMAFVVIQHLRSDTKSMLSEILGRKTRMPVLDATDGLVLRPNHVYIMPGNADLGISSGRLNLIERPEIPQRHLPIDHFFRELAADRGEAAVGIILSGAGSDGALGIREIKANGGVTFAQDPVSAIQGDMPRNAIEAGAIDFVLPPADIGREVGNFGRHPYVLGGPNAVELAQKEDYERILRQIFILLRSKTGVDFSGYKRSTFGRRLARRMMLMKIDDLQAYAGYLRGNPSEVEALYQDVLIMVTEFFREPETFDHLKAELFPASSHTRRKTCLSGSGWWGAPAARKHIVLPSLCWSSWGRAPRFRSKYLAPMSMTKTSRGRAWAFIRRASSPRCRRETRTLSL